MSTPPAKSFGRRTWAESPTRAPRREAARRCYKLANRTCRRISSRLWFAAPGLVPTTSAGHAAVISVAWSVRAAVLGGLIVGLINAAARATTFLSFGGLAGADKLPLENTLLNQFAPEALGHASLGQATVPIAVLVALAGLWAGAPRQRLRAFVCA
ncbi:MAG: hypothetical protein WDN29_07305 [Methylovirgula sp.]